MLGLLEEKLYQTVNNALDDSITVVGGPNPKPKGSVKKMLGVAASDLQTGHPTARDEVLTARSGSWLGQTHKPDASGDETDFKVPESLSGEISEVEAPPGHPMASGDDYFIQDRTVHFYRPPPKGSPGVAVYLRGDNAKGYREVYPCQIDIALTAWAQNAEDADDVFVPAFSALLAAFVELPIIRTGPDNIGVSLRLLKPAAVPNSISRTVTDIDGTDFHRVTAVVKVLGDLEVIVALGEAQPESIIESIEYKSQIKGERRT